MERRKLIFATTCARRQRAAFEPARATAAGSRSRRIKRRPTPGATQAPAHALGQRRLHRRPTIGWVARSGERCWSPDTRSHSGVPTATSDPAQRCCRSPSWRRLSGSLARGCGRFCLEQPVAIRPVGQACHRSHPPQMRLVKKCATRRSACWWLSPGPMRETRIADLAQSCPWRLLSTRDGSYRSSRRLAWRCTRRHSSSKRKMCVTRFDHCTGWSIPSMRTRNVSMSVV
jgi:hypothetical protein